MELYSQFGIASSKIINSGNETLNILDPLNPSIKIIDIGIANIHEEKKYMLETEVVTSAGGTIDILGITSDKHVFMGARRVQIKSEAVLDATIELYEDVTTTTVSSNTTSFNADRHSTATATFLINDAPATVTGGTKLPTTMFLLTSEKKSSVSFPATFQYAMKSNAKYSLHITNDGGSLITIIIFWSWTELP